NFINGMVGGYSGRFALPAGTNVITASYSGNDNFNPTNTNTTVIVSAPDFVFSSGQSSLTISAGSSASATVSLAPELNYAGTVSLTCSNAPAGSTCNISPSSVALSATQTATITISTSAPSPAPSAGTAALLKTLGGVSLAGLMFI